MFYLQCLCDIFQFSHGIFFYLSQYRIIKFLELVFNFKKLFYLSLSIYLPNLFSFLRIFYMYLYENSFIVFMGTLF